MLYRRSTWLMYLPMILTGLLTGMLISAGIWVWRELSDPQTLPFHQVRIQGQFQHLNPVQLQRVAEMGVNGGFFTLDMEALRRTLLTIPWVEDVAIRRIPGTLIIAVKEQQPMARWNDQYLVNSDQQLFLAPKDAPVGLPLLQGPADQQQIVVTDYLQISGLFKPLNIKIAQLQLNERGSVEFTLDNGIMVTVGRDEILPRVTRLAHWYPKLIDDKAGLVQSIDLRYQNSIAIAWKTT
jgi:cell division protein FtsQ